MIEQATPNALQTARDLLRANRPREAAALLSAFLQEHPHDQEAWHILCFALLGFAPDRILNPRFRSL